MFPYVDFKGSGGGEGRLQQFIASDGARIAYRDQGEGRPVLLLHGLMAHGGFFRHQAELVRDFRLITVDLRGHGVSQTGKDCPTVARLAADICELIGALSLTDLVGIGWSLGASVLFDLLSGPAAGRFAGAVIVDMTPRVLNGEGWNLGLDPAHCAERAAAIRSDFPAFSVAAGQAIFAGTGAGASDAAWAAEAFLQNDPDVVAALWDSLAETDFRAALPRISQPVLIAHGARSHLYGAETAAYLAAALPDARRVEFDRAGHAPHMEQPELFNQIVKDFAASLPRIAEPQTTD